MTLNLKENHAEILAQWANGKNFRLGRRAWLVEEHSKGMGTKELSRAVAMPEQRVVEIIDRYKESGLLGLIESPRSGRAKKISDDIVKGLVDEMPYKNNGEITADELIGKIQHDMKLHVSKDAVWRQTRILGIRLTRNSQKQIRLIDSSQGLSALTGIVISSKVKIIAIIKNQGLHLPMPGYLEATCENLSDLRSKNIEGLFNAIELIEDQENSKMSKRFMEEAITRWASNVAMNGKRKRGSLEMMICGDFLSDEMGQWLKALKRFNLCDGAKGIAKAISYALTEEEWAVSLKGLSKALPKSKRSADFIWARAGSLTVI